MRNIKLYYVPNNQFKSRTRSRALALVFFMNYRKVYKMLVDNRLANPLQKGVYGEVHHIVPKAEGGSDDNTNLVKLTGREHYIAHLLLAKIYDDLKMYSALVYMRCGNELVKRNFKFNSRLYEKMRIKFGLYISKNNKGKMAWNKGKRFSDEARQHMRESALKRPPTSEETKRKMSITHTGKKHSLLRKESIRKSRLGYKWITNGTLERPWHSDILPNGWRYGRIYKKTTK